MAMAGGDFATFTPGGGPLNDPRSASDIRAYEHIEALCGQEDAILNTPHEKREAHHHERLKKIEQELDQAFERLRHRHEKRQQPADGS
jgi:tryptophan 2,3-dioxygenase